MAHAFASPGTELPLARLEEMRAHGGPAQTVGLTDKVIGDFLEEDPRLALAIERAYTTFIALKDSHADFLALAEVDRLWIHHHDPDQDDGGQQAEQDHGQAGQETTLRTQCSLPRWGSTAAC